MHPAADNIPGTTALTIDQLVVLSSPSAAAQSTGSGWLEEYTL